MGLISFTQFFSSIPLLSDNASHTKYTLPEKPSDEEYIKHHKSILPAGCLIFGGGG